MFNFTFRMNTDGHLKTSNLRQFHAIWLLICLLQPNTILCFLQRQFLSVVLVNVLPIETSYWRHFGSEKENREIKAPFVAGGMRRRAGMNIQTFDSYL